jgi:putative FmdB family regulatory protein
MPLYEFHCEDCKSDFEKRRAMQEANAPLECPECESTQVTRKMSKFIALTKNDSGMTNFGGGGGCGCGGACACGGHSMN